MIIINVFIFSEIDPRLKGLIVVRNPDWVQSTGENLSILVKQVCTVRSHQNWRVRLGLIECAEHLLLHCTLCVYFYLIIIVLIISVFIIILQL